MRLKPAAFWAGVNKEELTQLLTADFPKGLFEPYFNIELGTLWSALFDLVNQEIDLIVGEKSQSSKRLHFSLQAQVQNFILPNILEITMKAVDFETRAERYASSRN